MKVTVCELDNRTERLDRMLAELALHLERNASEFLLLPEMCFHEWLAADSESDARRWQAAVDGHARYIDAIGDLGVPAVVGTRPIVTEQRGNTRDGRRNQAYLWTRSGLRAVHEKYYLPDEADYWEAHWYTRGEPRFETCEVPGSRIGIQICTEMWFFEWARHFARAGVELLCVPRATPHGSTAKWLAGGQSAAVCAGAYGLSSNLWNPPGAKANCGGLGWIVSPEGDVLATTDEDHPFATADIDLDIARQSKQTYPRYVAE